MPTRGEVIGMVAAAVMLVLSYVVPGGRVLAIPFFFVLVLIMIFWSARVSAEREER
jgi:hypothetical protein